MASGKIQLPLDAILKGSLPDGTDLNNVRNVGLYALSGTATYTHKPSSDCYFLVVLKGTLDAGSGWQIAFGINHMYKRNFSSTEMGDWYQWSTTVVS